MSRFALGLVVVLAAATVPGCGGESSEPGPAMEASTPASTETAPGTTTEPATTGGGTTAEATTEAAEQPPRPPPGVPGFVAGYRSWSKLNDAPIPPRAADPHSGTKDVYASEPRRPSGRFPVGTVVVKEARRPGTDFVGLIAVMRKERGADPEHGDWVFVEYTRDAARAEFDEVASGAVCWSCHAGARDDYVFTGR